MSLPETIPVRYTEGEDAYLSVRPVVRQTFRLEELLDMVLGVTGKDVARIQQILRAGTVAYHFYRYWWPGFEARPEELAELLAHFPEAQPTRAFRIEECTAVVFETGGPASHGSFELSREKAERRRLLRSISFWTSLTRLARASAPKYLDYSYAQRADRYAREISPQEAASLASEAARLAPRSLRAHLGRLEDVRRIIFVCPRKRL